MVRKIGVERRAVALGELVLVAVDPEDDRAGLDVKRLAAARLVHRRVAGAAGGGAGLERVQRDLGALAGQRRGQLLDAVAAAPARAALAARG